ncbi:hypothetical protein BE17_12255 [Sorangium cellulosum]|uniref:Secreted protein n=1 Tax=Sorangium cellulosum TaxID=56 RepID=A0A150T1G6_SORCE|nr:hypothetical protein BE17_12255 [Sorangium cellulosum]
MLNAGRVALVIALSLVLPARAYARDPRSAPPPGVYGELDASSMLMFGLMPVTGIGVSSALALRWLDASLWLEARAFKALGRNDGAILGETTGAGAGATSLCRHREAVFLCYVVQIGAIRLSAVDDLRPAESSTPWFVTSGARGGAEWRVSRHLQVRGFLELHLVLLRPLLRVSTFAQDQTSRVAAIAGVGLTLPVSLR